MKMNNALKLIIAIVVSELAGIIGSVFTAPSIAGWYAGLVKPAINPPAWVFGPVWTSLFALMGIAAFLIWRKGLERRDVKIALGIYIGQLVLNTLWSIIFFGLHSPGGAFVEIMVLWLAILATIIAFARISKPAAWLLAPYILWVSFAGYLNYGIWTLNQEKVVTTMPSVQTAYDGKNTTFTIDGTPVTLVNGVSEVPSAPGAEAKVTTRYFGNEANGDLTGDGLPDTAFLVTQDMGGSGLFYYAVVAMRTADGYSNTNAVLVGDRIAPQSTYIPADARELQVNYATRKPGDPMTASPSVGATLYLKVTPAGALVDSIKTTI